MANDGCVTELRRWEYKYCEGISIDKTFTFQCHLLL
jgi:hypothetical protein